MQHKGSLARAVLPLVIQLRGGWHRVEDCHRAGRAVRANIVAAAISIVLIRGVRLGLGRRVRFGASGEAAVSKLFAGLPKSAAAHLIVVDA